MIKINIFEKTPKDIVKAIAGNEFSGFDIDNVEVCSGCQFRYCCITNIKREKSISKKTMYNTTECNYNPYIAKWEGEEGYKTLSECGVVSNEHEFSIDHDKIAKINAELWSEE